MQRSTDELRAALDRAIADAEAERMARPKATAKAKAKPGSRKRKAESAAGGGGGGGGGGDGPKYGIQTHDSQGKKRGGWYNRCQLLMECVLGNETDLCIRMSEHFYHGDRRREQVDQDQEGEAVDDGEPAMKTEHVDVEPSMKTEQGDEGEPDMNTEHVDDVETAPKTEQVDDGGHLHRM